MDWVFCHLVGDYVLQLDIIANTKGKNWYHLLVHCLLYVLPFRVVYRIDWRLAVLLVTHIIGDHPDVVIKRNIDNFIEEITTF